MNLTILDSWTLNPGFPEFVDDFGVIEMIANTTKLIMLPYILDKNGDETWHTCNIDIIDKFAIYENKTRTLFLFPDARTIGDFQFRCQLYDVNVVVRNTNYTFFIKIKPIPEPPKNLIIPKDLEMPDIKWIPIEPVI